MGKSPSSQSLRGLDGLNFFMADGRDGLAPHLSADLMRGAGRFNLVQVLTALCVGIGAGLSNLVGGFIVQGFGYPAGFWDWWLSRSAVSSSSPPSCRRRGPARSGATVIPIGRP